VNTFSKEELMKIASLGENDIGPTEENVKQKIVVPLLVMLGHKREELEFEYRTRKGGQIDIFIKNVPPDCKVLIDTKNYSENLTDHIEQIKGYTFDEAVLLAVLANGYEIRIYSPLRGVEFERSLLYSIKRKDIIKDSEWQVISGLLGYENLKNKTAIKIIEAREKEIKDTIAEEEKINEDYTEKIESIDADIEVKEDEIGQLRMNKEALTKEMENKKSGIWSSINLPLELFRIKQLPPYMPSTRTDSPPDYQIKAGRVTFQELVDAKLIKDGQTLYFYHTRLFKDEQAQIIVESNKLKYKSDGKIYSTSDLAKKLLIKHHFKRDDHGVAGPKYWKAEDGKLLNVINEQLRGQRGDRK
jgi:predicted type IV restriction endonuclease